MHMADALLSPAVGCTMWAAAAGTIAFCSAKVRKDLDDRKVPLMGVLGAFLFAAQMINFTIPATGSSGHIGGGLLLAILLGPYAAFLTIASVLMIQALFLLMAAFWLSAATSLTSVSSRHSLPIRSSIARLPADIRRRLKSPLLPWLRQ